MDAEHKLIKAHVILYRFDYEIGVQQSYRVKQTCQPVFQTKEAA